MTPIRLRFSRFCDLLVGEDGPKATIRDILAKGDTPFDPKPPIGGQRTYDGEDYLKWLAFEAVRAAGVRLHHAAKLMRYGHVAERFVDDLEAGKDTSQLYACFAKGKPGTSLGDWHALHYQVLSATEIGTFLAEHSNAGPGLEHFVSVPLLPIYTEARVQAAKMGLHLVGRQFFEGKA